MLDSMARPVMAMRGKGLVTAFSSILGSENSRAWDALGGTRNDKNVRTAKCTGFIELINGNQVDLEDDKYTSFKLIEKVNKRGLFEFLSTEDFYIYFHDEMLLAKKYNGG